MGSFDTITWQALTAVLTLAALAGSVLFWRLRGAVAGLRMLAVALLPAAAYLTGTLRLFWEIGDAFVSWALRLAFSPAVWLGLGLAVTSVLLFVLAGTLRRRGVGAGSRRDREALPGSASRPPAQAPRTPGSTAPAARDEDMDEIEAILKRHGIS